jgi:hypothetical protein
MTTNIVSMFCSSLAAFILGLVLSPSLMVTTGDQHRADAAFSDGVFQANLDFQNGRRPHLAVGRWSSERDRVSFAKAYQQRWRELFNNGPRTMPTVDDAQLTGYWDGIVDGARDGKSSQPFQDAVSNKGETALSVHASGYGDTEKQDYLNGYATGYKAGYYAERELEVKTTSNHF